MRFPIRSTRLVVFTALASILYCAYVGIGLSIGAGFLATALPRLLPEPAAPNVAPGSQAEPLHIVAALATVRDSNIAQAPLLAIPDWKGIDRINVLLLGMDQRDAERSAGIPTRTDTMIILSVDPVAKTAAMVSLPRDMWVQIPGLGEQRINEAYPYGESHHVDGGGSGLLERTIERNFGIHITNYAAVNFVGFEQVVDALGGVVIDVPRPLKDDAYPTPDYGLERVYFAPGPQLMDGVTALKYARSRHSDNDLARNARQQAVLVAIRDRTLRFDSLSRLPALVDIGTRAAQSDFSAGDLLSLGKLASQVSADHVKTLVIQPPLVRDFRGVGGAALLMPDTAGIRKAIQQLLEDSTASQEPAEAGT